MAKRVQLRGEMTWSNSRLRRGLREGEAMLRKTSQNVGRMRARLGIGGAVGIFGVRALLTEFDRFGKLSQQFQIPVDFIQKLNLAAKKSGGSLEGAAKGMRTMIVNAHEAQRGIKTYAREFEALEIDIESFMRLKPEDQWRAFADAVKNAANQQRAYAAVARIMGSRQAELINLLRAGSDGFDKMTASMDRLGDQGVKRVEELNDKWAEFVQNVKANTLALATGDLSLTNSPIVHGISRISDFVGDSFSALVMHPADLQGRRHQRRLLRDFVHPNLLKAIDEQESGDVSGSLPGDGGGARRARAVRSVKVSNQFAGLERLIALQKFDNEGGFFGEDDPVFGNRLNLNDRRRLSTLGMPTVNRLNRSNVRAQRGDSILLPQGGEGSQTVRVTPPPEDKQEQKKQTEKLEGIETATKKLAAALE